MELLIPIESLLTVNEFVLIISESFNALSESFSIKSESLRIINESFGINSESTSQISFDTNFSFDLSALTADITSDEALDCILDFIDTLSSKSTELGAVSNRLESALKTLQIQNETLISTRSTLRDADIAQVSSDYIKQQILQQASATLLSTANQSPSIALQLI